MTLTQLLGQGYFCEELPTPFNSKSLGANSAQILVKIASLPKPKDGFNWVNFFSPNRSIHRRHFSIPHPYPQIKISELIVNKWNDVELEYRKSNFSISKPEVDKTGSRAIIYLDKYEQFREACIIASSTKRYQLHMDIAKYFYSIYTHSIPWAIHTKVIAKANKKNTSLWGNQIDGFLMMAQSFQTKGISVGTDTSRIIAEILGCAIDAEFELSLKPFGIKLKGYRFVDDCRFFFDTLRDAELALDQYHKILTSYGLGLNEEKTIIESAPCAYENVWKLPLNSAPLERFRDKNQRTDLKNYFNLLISSSKDHPKEPVIKYGIKRIGRITIHKNNIEIFESLLFCVSLHEPSILPYTFELLNQYKSGILITNLSEFIVVLIEQNVHKGHHFEVSWALWIAKYFDLILPSSLVQKVIDSRDVVSSILALDLINSKKVNGTVNTKDLESDLDATSLNSEYWLLAYEAEFQGWLPLKNIISSPFFKVLKNQNISFYSIPTISTTSSTNVKPARIAIKKNKGARPKSSTGGYQSIY